MRRIQRSPQYQCSRIAVCTSLHLNPAASLESGGTSLQPGRQHAQRLEAASNAGRYPLPRAESVDYLMLPIDRIIWKQENMQRAVQ